MYDKYLDSQNRAVHNIKEAANDIKNKADLFQDIIEKAYHDGIEEGKKRGFEWTVIKDDKSNLPEIYKEVLVTVAILCSGGDYSDYYHYDVQIGYRTSDGDWIINGIFLDHWTGWFSYHENGHAEVIAWAEIPNACEKGKEEK